MKLKESDVQKQILSFCQYHTQIYAWRNHSVGIFDPKRKVFRTTGKKGVSDILGIIKPWGIVLACEVKAPGKLKTVTFEQMDFLEKVKQNGGCAILADSLDLFKFELDSFISDRIYSNPGYPS